MANVNHSYFVPIRFRGADKSYYFSTEFSDLKLGDLVVVDSANGYTMGFVSGPAKPLSDYHSTLELKPVLRKPTKSDMLNHSYNLREEKRALEIVKEEIDKLGLPMDLLDAVYTLDGTYVTITYTSPEKRVDFRELLHQINPILSCRVELRQIAPRDRAKMTGGIGMCGLPLCCSTFLTSFESISIGKAKNQMLTLNIPKLSGHCGKLVCCLSYEDDFYTEAKKEFPKYGTVIHLTEGDYTVDSFNVISRMVRLANATRDDFKTYELDDIIAMQNGTYKERLVIKKKEDELPSFGIVPENKAEERSKPNHEQNRHQQNKGRDQERGREQGKGNNKPFHQHQRNNNNQQGQQQQQNQRRDQNQHRGHDNQNRHKGQNQNNQNNQNRTNNPQNPQQNQGDSPKKNNHRRFHHNHHRGNKPNNNGGNQQ